MSEHIKRRYSISSHTPGGIDYMVDSKNIARIEKGKQITDIQNE